MCSRDRCFQIFCALFGYAYTLLLIGISIAILIKYGHSELHIIGAVTFIILGLLICCFTTYQVHEWCKPRTIIVPDPRTSGVEMV